MCIRDSTTAIRARSADVVHAPARSVAYTRPIVDAGSPAVPNYENTEVEALQARIAALEAELDAVRRTQAVFALGLAHDMRTPLRAVESFSYLLEQRSDQFEAQSRDHLPRIREAGSRVGCRWSRDCASNW